jgi:hypothetical protein
MSDVFCLLFRLQWRSDDIGIFILQRADASYVPEKRESDDETPKFNDHNILSRD